MPLAKPAGFPDMVFNKSECGRYFFYKDEKLSVIIVPPSESNPDGLVLTNFYGGMLSNFSRVVIPEFAMWVINGKRFNPKNGEQVFKAACVVAHMDPTDETSDKALHLLSVLKAVMSAPSPKECKRATYAIPKEDFDGDMWDAISPNVMTLTQIWKCMDPEFFGFYKAIAHQAASHGIPFSRCRFTEAAGADDFIWGCGLSVEEMFNGLTSNLDDKVWNLRVYNQKPYKGKNLLGESCGWAFQELIGIDGEFLDETVDKFRERIGLECPVFSFEETKRSRTLSSDEPVFSRTLSNSSDEPVFSRTLSVDEPVFSRTLSVDEPMVSRTLSESTDKPLPEFSRTQSGGGVKTAGELSLAASDAAMVYSTPGSLDME